MGGAFPSHAGSGIPPQMRTTPPAEPPPRAVLGPVRAVIVAALLLALANAVVLASLRVTAQGWRLRGLHHLFQAGRALAAGLVAALLVTLALRLGLRGRRGLAAIGGVSLVIAAVTLPEELATFTANNLPAAANLALAGLVLAAALGVTFAAWLGHRLAGSHARWPAAALGVAALMLHPGALERGYSGIHLFVALAATTLIAASLSRAPLPRIWPWVAAAVPWALAAGLAAFTVFSSPSSVLRLLMLEQEGDVVTPYLVFGTGAGSAKAEPPEAWAPWFEPRDEAPDVAPGSPTFRGAPIVVLLTVDSLRADVLASREYDRRLPNLARLRDKSLNFTQARTPGSQTATSVTSLFAARYYSQLYWSSSAEFSHKWPWADETRRFPELLTAAGVATVHHASVDWFGGAVGVVRGFTEDNYTAPASGRFTLTADYLDALLARLADHREAPLLVYAHLMDAHHRASAKARNADPFERYMSGLEKVDAAIGEVQAEIKRLGLTHRTVLIVSADHGEAFGEHGTMHHQQTLYEELLRVPLMIQGPGIKPREVDVPVGLIDLGPTILDVFGVPTPGVAMGQSLAGFFRGRGKDPTLTRPLGAEGRLKRALLFPDDVKAIVDERNRTVEVYNLAADPGEQINLVDLDPTAMDRIAVVRRFFALHEHKRPGYTTPYRK